MSAPSPRDMETGTYRKDIKILHVKILPDCSAEEYDRINMEVERMQKTLGDQYVMLVTRHIDMNIEHMEDFLKRLEKESDAFKSPAVIDNLITSLKGIRYKKWGLEDKAREQQRAPGFAQF
jgi:hypothetical protein